MAGELINNVQIRYITDNGLVICSRVSEEDSYIWYGESKIAFTPDDLKTDATEVFCYFTSADTNRIISDKIKFSKEFVQKTLKLNPSLKDFFDNYTS